MPVSAQPVVFADAPITLNEVGLPVRATPVYLVGDNGVPVFSTTTLPPNADTQDVQAALDRLADYGGGVLRGTPGSTVTIEEPVFVRADNITVDLLGTTLLVPTHDFPVFSLSDPDDTDVAPDNVTLRNIRAFQQATQTDINSKVFYAGAQPEDYKLAALVHRGKGAGKRLVLENIYAHNFTMLVSDFGDWEDFSVRSGSLEFRNIETVECNFGLWTDSYDRLVIRGWRNFGTTFVQVSGGVLLPPHVLYKTNIDVPAGYTDIEDVYDEDSENGSTLKIKGATSGWIRKVRGKDLAGLVELYDCDKFDVEDCRVTGMVADPTLGSSQALYRAFGCRDTHFRRCDGELAAATGRLFWGAHLGKTEFNPDRATNVPLERCSFSGRADLTVSGQQPYYLSSGNDVALDIKVKRRALEQNIHMAVIANENADKATSDVRLTVSEVVADPADTKRHLTAWIKTGVTGTKLTWNSGGLVGFGSADSGAVSNQGTSTVVYTI